MLDFDMIKTYQNKPVVVIKQLKNLGPEPHYECLVANEKKILVPQPSGLIVEYTILDEAKMEHYLFRLKNGKLLRHRELGPSVIYEKSRGMYSIFLKFEYWNNENDFKIHLNNFYNDLKNGILNEYIP